jgi:hypothetical protein
MNKKRYEPSPFARNTLGHQRVIVGAAYLKGVLIGVAGTVVVGVLGCVFSNMYNSWHSYDQGYNDAPSYESNGWYFEDNIQFYNPISPIQYAIASADPAVLWGLDDPYGDQIIGPYAIGEMPFGIPLIACTVYLVTVDNNGQQAIAPVPADQVPSQYLGYVSGCNPASVVPWWVSDQFAFPSPTQTN